MSDSNKNNLSQSGRAYVKYSGMAIQMAVIITVFAYGGKWLDSWLGCAPAGVVVGSLAGVGISLYIFIKQVFTDSI